MAAKPWNPVRLDVPAFAHEQGELSGAWPAAALPRFAEGATPASEWPEVRWQLRGEERPVLGGAPAWWLHLRVQAQTQLVCQRCLQPVALPMEVDGAYRFVRDEAQAAELDADSEEDVLVASRAFDCREWVEDELLLALPIVPMHTQCPEPLPLPDASPLTEPEVPQAHPFAALAALKGKSGTGST